MTFLSDCVGAEVESATANPETGSLILLENLRFHLAEEGKSVNEAGEKVSRKLLSIFCFRSKLQRKTLKLSALRYLSMVTYM